MCKLYHEKLEEGALKMKKAIIFFILCMLIESVFGCGKETKSNTNSDIYGETIGGLEDDELFAIIETNASLPVLLVSSQVYNDGLGNCAALICDVYYLIDEEVKNIGTIESMGTAYPISYDKSGIYVASGHDMQRLVVDKSGVITLEEGIYEKFDENGNADYTIEHGDKIEEITGEEYNEFFEKYNNATVVSFHYGASDAV